MVYKIPKGANWTRIRISNSTKGPASFFQALRRRDFQKNTPCDFNGEQISDELSQRVSETRKQLRFSNGHEDSEACMESDMITVKIARGRGFNQVQCGLILAGRCTGATHLSVAVAAYTAADAFARPISFLQQKK